MKKITMLALFASALEFASSDAMIEKKLSSENVSKDRFAAIEVDPEREHSNGLLGLNRDIFLWLAAIMKNDDDKIRVLFGIGNECFLWKSHPYFGETRQHVFPKPWDVKEINKKLVNHFATLDGGYRRNHFLPGYTVGQNWFNEFFSLFHPKRTPDWKDKNQDKLALIMAMSFDACLDKCNSSDFKDLDPQEQAFYKYMLYLYLGRYGSDPISLNRLPELPYDAFLVVLANWEFSGKYASFFSKNQFRWIPIPCIEKGNFSVMRMLCDNKDKLPKKHLVAIDKRIDELVEQAVIACGAAEADYMAAVDGGFPVRSARFHRHSCSSTLDDVRKLREEFPKSCF